jgi:hypothetical protein
MTVNAMLYAQELTAGLLIATLLVASYASYRHRTQWRREERRFREQPLPGDKAGYLIDAGAYQVGEVMWVTRVDGSIVWVHLRSTWYSALGPRDLNARWPIDDLRWFPPDTPLGRYEEPAK